MAHYNSIKKCFEDNGCTLLTTYEEYTTNHMTMKHNYRIIAMCGHERESRFDNFKHKLAGQYCKNCIRSEISTRLKNAHHHTDPHEIEYAGFCAFRALIVNDFDVNKCVEGTLADFAVKPKTLLNDSWLPVQLKTRDRPNPKASNNYQFSLQKQYPDMIVVLYGNLDNKCWIIDGNAIQVCRLSIGRTRSKYDVNEVTSKNIVSTLLTFFHSKAQCHKTFYDINCPIAVYNKRSQMYVKQREELLNKIVFIYPEIEKLPYDFMINDVKIQEKVTSKHKHKNMYTVCHCRGFQPYSIGDNDIMWINIIDTDLCYLISERKLIDEGKRTKNAHNGEKQLYLFPYYDIKPNSNTVFNKYLFSYSFLQKHQEILANMTQDNFDQVLEDLSLLTNIKSYALSVTHEFDNLTRYN
jgi:uncharacterized protein YeeX (DUF496 family)